MQSSVSLSFPSSASRLGNHGNAESHQRSQPPQPPQPQPPPSHAFLSRTGMMMICERGRIFLLLLSPSLRPFLPPLLLLFLLLPGALLFSHGKIRKRAGREVKRRDFVSISSVFVCACLGESNCDPCHRHHHHHHHRRLLLLRLRLRLSPRLLGVRGAIAGSLEREGGVAPQAQTHTA